MIKNIELQGKIVKIEYILPDKIKKFLRKNNLDENKLLKDGTWKQSLQEDFFQRKVSFAKAKLVINYLRLTQDNQIRVPLEGLVQGKKVCSATWVKGSFFKEFSIG